MKYFKLTIFFLTSSILANAQEGGLSSEEIKKIDFLFKKWDNNDSPGAAIGVIQNGVMQYSKGYGLANIEHNIPNTTLTAFNIGSNTKQFTAACIVLLSQQGKLNLNQSLKSIFPDFPDYTKSIDIKNLLQHTSGLRDYPQIAYLTGLRPNDFYNNTDIMKWIKSQQKPNFLTGEKYMYSNSGYWLLGQIVSKVSGMSFAEFAKKELFEPLGMNSTRFYDNSTMVFKNKASGYSKTRSGEIITFNSARENIGDGGLYTTIEDIKKWDDEFYKQTILNDSFWKIMTTQGVLNNGKSIVYASGLEIKEHKGLKTISHGGRVPGFWSDIIRFPKQKFTVVVFTNSSNVDATPIGYQIADILLKEKYKPEKRKTNKMKRKVKFIKLSNGMLKNFEGTYWDAKDNSSRKVYLDNGTLTYYRGTGSIHPLKPIAKNEFKVMRTPPFIDAFVKFIREGEKYKLQTTINEKVSKPFNAYMPKTFGLSELDNLTGSFYSQEIDTNYNIKLEKDKLWLFVKGRKIVPLTHVRDLLFSSPMCDFEFIKNNDVIEGFKVTTSRVKNLKFKRVN